MHDMWQPLFEKNVFWNLLMNNVVNHQAIFVLCKNFKVVTTNYVRNSRIMRKNEYNLKKLKKYLFDDWIEVGST